MTALLYAPWTHAASGSHRERIHCPRSRCHAYRHLYVVRSFGSYFTRGFLTQVQPSSESASEWALPRLVPSSRVCMPPTRSTSRASTTCPCCVRSRILSPRPSRSRCRSATRLRELSRSSGYTCGKSDDPFHRGYCAFTHKAGIHAKAILNNPSTYEILKPEDFGLTRYVSIGSVPHISHMLHIG